MLQRIKTAILLIPLVFASTMLMPNNYFSVVLLSIVCVAIWEYCKIIKIKNWKLRIAYIIFITCIAVLLLLFEKVVMFTIVFASLWWLLNIFWIISYPHTTKFWNDGWFIKIINGVFIFIPMILSLSFIQKQDPEMALLCLILVWCADSGGLIIGNIFGKHKLLPKVSPNKTIEGAVGSFLFSIIFAIIYVILRTDGNAEQYLIFLLLSLLVTLYSIIGDLFESL